MKTWKFTISFLAASMMANSQLAFAASDLSIKKEYNKYLKEQVLNNGADFNSFYRTHRNYFDSQTQSWAQEWLETYGSDKSPRVETQVIKQKNGKETIQLVMSLAGQSATLVINDQEDDHFYINGVRFYYLEAMNISTIINRLAEKNSALKPLAMEMNSKKNPDKKAAPALTTAQVMKLSPLKKVEYFSHYRKIIEASQRVLEQSRKQSSYNSNTEEHFRALHPFFSNMIAWAQARPADGTQCLVAGNVSAYRSASCKSDPNNVFNQMCAESGSGNVACNPLVYGFAGPQKPHCLSSTNQPDFTLRATAMCNEKSPLPGEPKSKERNEAYKRILSSYYLNTNKEPRLPAECFNAQQEINDKCKNLFTGQVEQFKELQAAADIACQNKTLPDQPDACAALKQRTLELALFAEEVAPEVLPAGSAIPTVGDQLLCEGQEGKKWDKENQKCVDLTTTTSTTVKAVAEKPEKKKKCQGDKKSITCSPLFWLGLFAGGIGLLMLLKKKKKKTPRTPVGPSNPPTVTTPSTPPNPPAPRSEGGDGTNPADAGGVR